MNVFITSSPYLDGADRAILNPENHFVENLREVLPPFPRVLKDSLGQYRIIRQEDSDEIFPQLKHRKPTDFEKST